MVKYPKATTTHNLPTVRVLNPAELSPHHLSAWRDMISKNPQLSSPFFSPEYSLAVASVVPHVSVGISERGGVPEAFLPFERSAFAIGKRLRLCDYQGLVSMPEQTTDVRWFIRRCGLRALDFDHLLAAQADFASFHRRLDMSYLIDISGGFDAYVEERHTAGTKQIRKSRNLERRLVREQGKLRFAVHVEDPAVLEQLLKWRSSKYPASRHRPEVVAGILRSLLHNQSPDCRGTLSVLYVNERIAACHFGLRSQSVWHYWFPSYNPEFELYSPGSILLLKMAETSPTLGIKTIDLGKGEQDYKKRFASRTTPIAEGYVSASIWLTCFRSLRGDAKHCLQHTPILSAFARKNRLPASTN